MSKALPSHVVRTLPAGNPRAPDYICRRKEMSPKCSMYLHPRMMMIIQTPARNSCRESNSAAAAELED